jgi:hypothetical protein
MSSSRLATLPDAKADAWPVLRNLAFPLRHTD